VSVGDKLSDATAPDEVPELQLFGAFTTEDGAPPPSYWEGLCGQLKKGDREDDFPEIEVLVFNCLVLGPKGMNQAENGRLFSFDPPPLLCIGTGDIKARVTEEVLVISMHGGLLPHQTGITKAPHDLTRGSHKVGEKISKVLHVPRKH
jgi:hypothetical protein